MLAMRSVQQLVIDGLEQTSRAVRLILLARFIQLRGGKRFDEWTELFVEDGAFEYAGQVIVGRAAVRESVGTLLRHDAGTNLCLNSITDVVGETATAPSDSAKADLTDSPAAPSFVIRTMGRYDDRLVRRDHAWRNVSRRVDFRPTAA